MLEDLKYLIKLQEIDLRIKEQELAQEHYPANMEELRKQISKAETALSAIKEKLHVAENDKKNWEEQVDKARAGLEKSQDRLNSIRTNREYDAVHAEIEAQKSIINGAEHRQGAITADIEKLTAAVAEAQTELDRVKSENDPQINELQAKVGAIDSIIAEITKERNVIVPNITKPVFRQYDLIKSKRKNARAISVIATNRTCAVCYKVLEPQLLNEIKRGAKVILCQHCGSIMVWGQAAIDGQ